MTYQPKTKEDLLQAIEYAETMALHTIEEDPKLKETLFAMGQAYKNPNVTEESIKKLLKKFYSIDPEFIRMIKNAETPKRNG